VSDQSTPAKHWHVFNVQLPASCQNPEYSIRKMLGSDHGGELYINYEVHANLSQDELERLLLMEPDDLKKLVTGPAAVKVGGVTPLSGRSIWSSVRTFWKDIWKLHKKE
jgi:hypothetical protein